MFFLCDGQGQINEVSENCKTLLNFSNKYLTNNELRTDSDKVRIQDLIPDVNINKMKDTLPPDLRLDPQIFEISCDINLDVVNYLLSSEKSAIYRNRRGRAFSVII